MHMQSGFASVNGTRLYYEMAGKGHPLIFVHGFSLDTTLWDEQFAFFAKGHRVLRYDLRGFGHSMHPGTKSYGHEADLKALMEYLEMDRAHLVGHSLGGMIAIDFALTYPESLQSLVLDNALFAGFTWTQEWDARTNLVWEIARREGVLAAKQSWQDHPIFTPCLDYPAAAAHLADMLAFYSGWHFVNDNPAHSPDPPADLRLRDIAAPSLVLVGERNLPDFHKMADRLAREIPHAHKLVLPNVGHMANLEQPELFNEIVAEFLASIPEK